MFKLEFGIVHRGCVVNKLSRALPQVRLICPAGFVLDASSAYEILALDNPADEDVRAAIDYLKGSDNIAQVSLLERTADKAFIHIVSSAAPETGYCSQAVARNLCFPLSKEVQHGGVEQWEVGCMERSQADRLVEDLKGMGDLKYHRISQVSWAELAP